MKEATLAEQQVIDYSMSACEFVTGGVKQTDSLQVTLISLLIAFTFLWMWKLLNPRKHNHFFFFFFFLLALPVSKTQIFLSFLAD